MSVVVREHQVEGVPLIKVLDGLFIFDLNSAGGNGAVSLGPSDLGSFSRTV